MPFSSPFFVMKCFVTAVLREAALQPHIKNRNQQTHLYFSIAGKCAPRPDKKVSKPRPNIRRHRSNIRRPRPKIRHTANWPWPARIGLGRPKIRPLGHRPNIRRHWPIIRRHWPIHRGALNNSAKNKSTNFKIAMRTVTQRSLLKINCWTDLYAVMIVFLMLWDSLGGWVLHQSRKCNFTKVLAIRSC